MLGSLTSLTGGGSMDFAADGGDDSFSSGQKHQQKHISKNITLGNTERRTGATVMNSDSNLLYMAVGLGLVALILRVK